MPLDMGDLPPGVTVGEDGQLVYSEEEQMLSEGMEGEEGMEDFPEGGLPGEEGAEGEMDLKDEIAALAEEEGVTEAVEQEMEAIDELEADIQAMMQEEEGGVDMPEMQPISEDTAEETSNFNVTLPDDEDL
jgi:hypothetical protein